MTEYRVTWEIDVEESGGGRAAAKARQMQLNPRSTATVYKVRPKDADPGSEDEVDLDEIFDPPSVTQILRGVLHDLTPDELLGMLLLLTGVVAHGYGQGDVATRYGLHDLRND